MNDLQETLENSITVEEMIEQLRSFDPKAFVVFHYTSGDYWGTEVADPVTTIEGGKVRYSDYHKTLALAIDEDSEELANVVMIG